MANHTNWLSISAMSGTSGQTILSLSASKNLERKDKTAEIIAYNPVLNVSAKTYVRLDTYAPYINLSPTIIGVEDTGGTYELNITANCPWVISYPDLVTNYSTSAGTGNATISFTVPGTSADTTLVGNIVVTDESGQVSKIARIEQYGSGVHIGIQPVELYFDATGGTKVFVVTANCVYNVRTYDTDWATVEPNSGYTGQTTFTVTVNHQNTGSTVLEGQIDIAAPGSGGAVVLYQKARETRLVGTYNVTSSTDPTKIIGAPYQFSKAELADGTEIPLATGYTFPITGYQEVYLTLTGDTVGTSSLNACPTLESVFIPSGVTAIGDNAFRYCSSLTSVTIPDTVTGIGRYAFSETPISNITLPDGLQTLGFQTFGLCYSLTSIDIPSSVTSIGGACFYPSTLETIYFHSPTPPTLGNDALDSGHLKEIIVPCVYVDAYLSAWPQYAEYISCQDETTLYFITDTSNVQGRGETRTITLLNRNLNPNRIGLSLPSDFPSQGAYTVSGNVITLTYPPNPSTADTRSWRIGIVATTKDGVNLWGTYAITQNPYVVYSIPYTADTSPVVGSGETRTITIDTTNLVASSITISMEGDTGITYTYNNGVITVVFPFNYTSEIKDVTFTITGVTTDDIDAFASISYMQYSGEAYSIPYTADTSTVNETGETRYIYIDCSQLIGSSITVSSSGIPGIIASYDSATCIVTVVFPNISGGGYEVLDGTITIEGQTIYGNYAYAVVYYEQAGADISILPLTFVIKTDGYIRWGQTNTQTTDSKAISYKKNDGGWNTIVSSVIPLDCPKINVVAGDVLRFKGNNETYGSGLYGNAHFQDSTAEYNVYGNIMSMVYGDNFSGQTALTGTLCEFFEGEGIRSAKNLLLPTTSLETGSYESMFANCNKLTQAPLLPATSIRGTNVYKSMFAYCTSLTQVPRLPQLMDIGIYNSGKFAFMFEGCTGLTTIPSDYLPALVQGVETGDRLPPSCFAGMFKGCTNLTKAPDLPYPTLGDNCYASMFQGCSALTGAPELPAIDLVQGCYSNMFDGCTNLSAITCLARDISASGCTSNWVKDVAQSGIFTKNFNMKDWTRGNSGIPTNWVVQDKEPTILSGNSLTVTYNVTSTTQPTQILYDNPNDETKTLLSFEMMYYNGTPISIQTGYTFPSTGPQTVVFYLRSTTIPDFAFSDLDVVSCTMGEGITELGYDCFSGSALTSITIGTSVTTLRDNCLYETASLSSLTIPSSVTSIGATVKNNCQDLTIDSNAYMSASGSTWDGKIGKDFPGVTNIHIGSNVTTIGSYSFLDRSNNLFFVGSITFTNNLTRLEPYAFYNFHNCNGQLGITLPDSVTSIGVSCFEYCGFNEVILPSGITSLPAGCFKQAYNITSITIPDSVVTIGDSCFEGISRATTSAGNEYSRLKNVVIGSGVTTIGTNAFKYVLNIENLTCNATTAPSIQSNTFEQCGPAAYTWYDSNGRPHWYYNGVRTLYHPDGSDYSSWLQTADFYLGKYGWTEGTT